MYIYTYIHIYDLLLDNSKDNHTFKSCAGQVTSVRLTNQTTRKYMIPQSPAVEGNNVSRQKEKKMTKNYDEWKTVNLFILECHQFLISLAFAKLKQCQLHPLLKTQLRPSQKFMQATTQIAAISECNIL